MKANLTILILALMKTRRALLLVVLTRKPLDNVAYFLASSLSDVFLPKLSINKRSTMSSCTRVVASSVLAVVVGVLLGYTR